MSYPVPPRLLLQQGAVVSAFVLGALKSLLPGTGRSHAHSDIMRVAPAASESLLAAYAGWARAKPYVGEVPPSFVACQVALPVISALTARSPYPLLGVLNQGLHLTLHEPVPAGVPLSVRGHLVEACDDGFRARIHSSLSVGTSGQPRMMSLDAYAAVVLKQRGQNASPERELLPWRVLGHWQAREIDGRRFFYLTGDFNPIHTWPAFARKTSFKGCIMHGYGAFAQLFEVLRHAGFALADIDIRFIKPLPLPSAEVRIEVAELAGGRMGVRLADALGTVYQIGSFSVRG